MDRVIWQHLLDNDAFGLVANAYDIHALLERDDKVGCGGLGVDSTPSHVEDCDRSGLRDARDEELVALGVQGNGCVGFREGCRGVADIDRERLVHRLTVGVEAHGDGSRPLGIGECCNKQRVAADNGRECGGVGDGEDTLGDSDLYIVLVGSHAFERQRDGLTAIDGGGRKVGYFRFEHIGENEKRRVPVVSYGGVGAHTLSQRGELDEYPVVDGNVVAETADIDVAAVV